jgi:phosphate transport system substrate-binding protein
MRRLEILSREMDRNRNIRVSGGLMKIALTLLATAFLMLQPAASRADDVTLTGAGATFPKPLYEKWASEYMKAHPGVRINYQGIGSGGGIKQIGEKTVDFGATDGPMTDKQLEKAPGILHIPMILGAVVPVYNLSEVGGKALVFDGPVLADLFLGKIKKWNDPAIAKLNPGVNLPDKPVTIVHRSDGSGTTYIWTDYLSKVSDGWKSGPGKATTVNWPVGRGAKGNDGVAGDVKQNPGSLGYVELIYAANNNISYGDVVNPAGKTIHASEESVSAAAASLKDPAEDLRISITNAEGDASYPISSFTWILVYKDQPDAAKAKVLLDFLNWATHEGQSLAAPLHYAPLPKEFIPLVEKKLKSVSAGGVAVLAQ